MSNRLSRRASDLYVYYQSATAGDFGPVYNRSWTFLPDASVELIELNDRSTPWRAFITLERHRWNDDASLKRDDRIKIIDRDNPAVPIFAGFITARDMSFFGASDRGGAFERLAFEALGYMYLLHMASVFGQWGRNADGDLVGFSGRRCIFNADGYPDADPDPSAAANFGSVTVFGPRYNARYWQAREMICYAATYHRYYDLFPITASSLNTQLSDSDFDIELQNISIEGLTVAQAISHITALVGWSFRESVSAAGPALVFYKPSKPFKLHQLYAPQPGEDIAAAVKRGEKMLWAMNLKSDVSRIVNDPWALGDVGRFEITTELVPGWKDSELVPDLNNLFFSEAALAELEDPNQYNFYKYYHSRGSQYKASVGRLWVLNETGYYSAAEYDRGEPFDFNTVIPEEYSADANGVRSWGRFARTFLNCVTLHTHTYQSMGVRVEFSFDGGVTWQIIPCAVINCRDQCAIMITDPNLSELKDQNLGAISGGDLDGQELSYWTSLCDDKLAARSFKNGDWKTRIRVTACVRLDQRMLDHKTPSPGSGSLFRHSKLFDYSDKYKLVYRTPSSLFSSGTLGTNELLQREKIESHVDAIHAANQDAALAGQFTLDRLYLVENGEIAFLPGDCISAIKGRDYNLSAGIGNSPAYPEIIQVVIMPQKQKMKLITRDMRFAESDF